MEFGVEKVKLTSAVFPLIFVNNPRIHSQKVATRNFLETGAVRYAENYLLFLSRNFTMLHTFPKIGTTKRKQAEEEQLLKNRYYLTNAQEIG
ncbi:hypothetical protein HQ585_01400 [candidate division KSB1 bacterium]|nr:hypothetical protein [candidate division KSB1 bacterium]